MPLTKPSENIIPREIPENIRPTIGKFTDMIEECVNFGSHITEWNLQPESAGEENIPSTMLFRHFLDIIDSASVLVSHACGDTSKILMRAAFEASLNLLYLFETDTYNRSMAFLVNDILEEIKSLERIDPSTEEGKRFYNLSGRENLLKNLNTTGLQEQQRYIQSKYNLLKQPQFQKAYSEYQKISKKSKSLKWFQYFNGPKNIFELAKHLKKGTQYNMFYRTWSGPIHSSDVISGKLFAGEKKGTVDIVQLRYVKDIQDSVVYSHILCFETFREFIKARIPEKMGEFSNWHSSVRGDFDEIVNKQFIVMN